MFNRLTLAIVVLLLFLFHDQPVGAAPTWQLVISTSDHIRVYTRQHPGTTILEVRGVSYFSVPCGQLRMTLHLIDHLVGNVPYLTEIKEVKILRRQRWVYQRVSPPVVDDRDYTVLLYDVTPRTPQAKSPLYYAEVYVLDEKMGPAPKPGVVRTPVNEGFWLLLPTKRGKGCLTINNFVADPGGLIPDFLINLANTKGLPYLMRGLRKLAEHPRNKRRLAYLGTRPPKLPSRLRIYLREVKRLVKHHRKPKRKKRDR